MNPRYTLGEKGKRNIFMLDLIGFGSGGDNGGGTPSPVQLYIPIPDAPFSAGFNRTQVGLTVAGQFRTTDFGGFFDIIMDGNFTDGITFAGPIVGTQAVPYRFVNKAVTVVGNNTKGFATTGVIDYIELYGKNAASPMIIFANGASFSAIQWAAQSGGTSLLVQNIVAKDADSSGALINTSSATSTYRNLIFKFYRNIGKTTGAEGFYLGSTTTPFSTFNSITIQDCLIMNKGWDSAQIGHCNSLSMNRFTSYNTGVSNVNQQDHLIQVIDTNGVIENCIFDLAPRLCNIFAHGITFRNCYFRFNDPTEIGFIGRTDNLSYYPTPRFNGLPILFENCVFHDMSGSAVGALVNVQERIANVEFKNCQFQTLKGILFQDSRAVGFTNTLTGNLTTNGNTLVTNLVAPIYMSTSADAYETHGLVTNSFFLARGMGYRTYTAFDSAYKAVIDYAVAQGYTLPSASVQLSQSKLVYDLKALGIWDKLDVFYNFFGNGDHNFAKINWKNPGTFQAVGTGHEPTYTPFVGFKANGSTQYLSTGFIPATHGVNYKIADAGVFADVLITIEASLQAIAAIIEPGIVAQFYIDATGKLVSQINTGAAVTGSIVQLSTFGHAYQFNPNARIYQNGAQSVAGASTGATLNTFPFFLLARNNAGAPNLFGNDTIRCFGAGAALQGSELVLYNTWNRYKSGLSARIAYEAIAAYATLQGYTLPSDDQQSLQIALITDLMFAGVWDKLDVFYNFLHNGDADFARINWKNPGVNQIANSANVYVENSGFRFLAPTAINYAPDGLSAYKQDDASLAVDMVTAGSGGNAFDSALLDNFFTALLQDDNFHLLWALNDQTVKDTNLGPYTLGYYSLLLQRKAVNSSEVWRNGFYQNGYNDPSVGLPVVPFTYSAAPQTLHRMLAAGASLEGAEAQFNSAWQIYVGYFSIA
jgi:hypothetical protein